MMKRRTFLIFALSAMALGGTTVACSAQRGGIASAGTSDHGRAVKQAASAAADADRALAKGKAGQAVTFAETAVSLMPQDPHYRALLGQSYLAAGRFTSAREALSDALALDPNQGRAALSLALAQTAGGDFASARATLDKHSGVIATADRGLAVALAGDPASAVIILTVAARAPDADAKTRQNLALALALGGRWQEAKVVASADLDPAEVDRRIAQWASFARPGSASDQVATLLGVTPVSDPGQPTALALNVGNQQVAVAVQSAAPIDSYMPGVPANANAVLNDMQVPPTREPQVATVEVPASVAPVEAAPAPIVKPQLSVNFSANHEVTQPVPHERAPAMALGGFVVQLGAYRSAAAVRSAWTSASNRHPALASRTPSSVPVGTRHGTFYRLSVGSFARADAEHMCAGLKADGATCFVRAAAGDKVASWARAPQVASR